MNPLCMGKDSSVPLLFHDPSDPVPLILTVVISRNTQIYNVGNIHCVTFVANCLKRSALAKLTSFRSSHLCLLLVLKNGCGLPEGDTSNSSMFIRMIMSSVNLDKGCKYSLK